MPTFDFEDGRGPVPAHKHENGGGWVEDTAIVDKSAYVGPEALVYGNASVLNNASIHGTSRVFENASVEDNARVFGSSLIYGASTLAENAFVSGNVRIHGDATIAGNARILNQANVFGLAYIKDGAMVSGDASVGGAAQILDKASVGDDAQVGGAAIIRGKASIEELAFIGGSVLVYEIARIGGNTQLLGNVRAYGNARLLGGDYSGGEISSGSYTGLLVSTQQQRRSTRIEQPPKLMSVSERMEALQKQGEKINKPVEYKESEAAERARHVREELEHVPRKVVERSPGHSDAAVRSKYVLEEVLFDPKACQECGHKKEKHYSGGCSAWADPEKALQCTCTGWVKRKVDRAVKEESDASARSKLIENPDAFLRYLQKAVNACVKYVCKKVEVPVFPCDVELSKKRGILGHTKSHGFRSSIVIAINKEGFLALSEKEQAAVLIHEVCHGVVFHYGKSSQGDNLVDSHGPMWRAVMKRCGMDPDDTLRGVV